MATVPPPFQTPPPEARATKSANKACLVAVVLVAGGCLVICGIGAFAVKGIFGQAMQTASCAEMFDLAQKATLAYAKDHHGKFPAAETWEDDIRPYYKNLYNAFESEAKRKKLPHDVLPPAPGEPMVCKWEGRSTGIAYNIELSNKLKDSFKEPEKTAVVFEVDRTGRNQSEKYTERPKATAPKIMYNERDWMVFYITGNSDPFETDNSSNIKIKVDDGLDGKGLNGDSGVGNKSDK